MKWKWIIRILWALLALSVSIVGGIWGTSHPVFTSPPSQKAAANILVLNVIPGVSTAQLPGQLSQSDIGVTVIDSGSTQFNFSSAFAFAPLKGFTNITSVQVTLLYSLYNGNAGDIFSIRINGVSVGKVPEKMYQASYPLTTTGPVKRGSLDPGLNIIDIGINQGGSSLSQVYLFQVMVTVDYTYLT